MMEATNETKRDLGVKWVKADSGVTYLCPTDVLDRIDAKSEYELRMICVEESTNPQNN